MLEKLERPFCFPLGFPGLNSQTQIDPQDTNMRLNRGWMAEAEAQSPDYFQSFMADSILSFPFLGI